MGLGCLAGFWLAFAAVSGVAATDVERLAISQAHSRLPAIKAYIDIVDGGGKPPAGLATENLSAQVGANGARVVSVSPFSAVGEGVAYVFLVDVSRSIGRSQFEEMRSAIRAWIEGLKPSDRVAIATFGEEYRLLSDFTPDKQKLRSVMDALVPRDMHTRLYQAIVQAVDLHQRIDPGLPFRRVIILLSDGKDEGSALTPDDVLVKLRASRLPIYAIGLSHLSPSQKQRYLDVLRRFSNVSGGLYEDGGSQSVARLYAAIQQAILRVFVVSLACSGCPADGRSYPLRVTFTGGTRVLQSAALDILAVPGPRAAVPPPPLAWWRRVPLLAWVAVGLALLAAGGFAVRRKREADSGSPAEKAAAGPLGLLEEVLHGHRADPNPNPPAAGGLPMKLTVVAGKDAGSSHELQVRDKVVIGRADDCDFVVTDPEVSNHHCELTLMSGRLMVRDMGSTNNTYLNGVPIRGRHKLEPLDTIQVGDTELRVHFEAK